MPLDKCFILKNNLGTEVLQAQQQKKELIDLWIWCNVYNVTDLV